MWRTWRSLGLDSQGRGDGVDGLEREKFMVVGMLGIIMKGRYT